jgi:transcriptional regulator GlxA family with amidase domain
MPNKPLFIEVLWGEHSLQGSAMAMQDVFLMINGLANMRSSKARVGQNLLLSWRWISETGGSVPRYLNRHCLPEHWKSHSHPGADIVILPGWHAYTGPQLDQRIQSASHCIPKLVRTYDAGGTVVAVQEAIALVGAAGLLKGKMAVSPWALAASVLRHSPETRFITDQAWVHSNRIWSCDSTALATEVILDVLKNTGNSLLAELAVSAEHVLLHSNDRQKVSLQVVQDALRKPVPLGALQRAKRYLEEHLTEPYDLKHLAQVANTSPRTLLRHYSATFQHSPLEYLQNLRMARARVLLETTYLPVEQVALACGYGQISTFRRIFSKATGQNPATYRERYKLRTSRKRWGLAA